MAISVLSRGDYGVRVHLRSAWSDGLLSEFPHNEDIELVLNSARGWTGTDVNFISKLPRLKGLFIAGDEAIVGLPPHVDLKGLHLGCPTSQAIDFTIFPALKDLTIVYWSPLVQSIFEVTGLETLKINHFLDRDLSRFHSLSHLKELAILNARLTTIEGISALRNLESIEFGRCLVLQTITGIESCQQLKTFRADTCKKIESFEELSKIPSLSHVAIDNCGDIRTISFFRINKNLRVLSFIESTNVLDGDLTSLLANESLGHLSFANRKHYSHTSQSWHVAKFPSCDWPRAHFGSRSTPK